MLRTMITATNTMSQLQQQLDTIGNNIANSSTHGYKTKDAKFSELLYQQFNNDKLDKTERQSPVGIRYGVGAMLGQIQMNNTQGSLQTTDRDLDIAFTQTKQYFNILKPNGDNGEQLVYSRQGDFYVSPLNNDQLMLVNGDGYPVAGSNGQAITFPDGATGFGVTEDGTLNVQYADNQELSFELGITVLNKPQLMEHISGTYIGLPDNLVELGFTEAEVLTDLQGGGRQQAAITNGALEMSNVDLSKEMTDLIATQRSYQFNARAVTMADQMLGLINGIR